MKTRVVDHLINRFNALEKRIDPQNMSVERVNELTQSARELLTDVNHAIKQTNKAELARYGQYEKRALTVLATLAHCADTYKPNPRIS